MSNFVLLLMVIDCILLSLIALNITKKLCIPIRLLELMIVMVIILTIAILTLFTLNR